MIEYFTEPKPDELTCDEAYKLIDWSQAPTDCWGLQINKSHITGKVSSFWACLAREHSENEKSVLSFYPAPDFGIPLVCDEGWNRRVMIPKKG